MPLASYDLRFAFTQLECIANPEGTSGDEPYMWIFFYKIDGDGFRFDTHTAKLVGRPIVQTHQGNALLLQPDKLSAGHTAGIDYVGQWKGTLRPINAIDPAHAGFQLPGLFGFIVVLLEQDASSYAQREAGHARFNAVVEQKLAELLTRMDISQLKVPHLLAAAAEEASQAIVDEVCDAMSEGADLSDLLDADDMVGMITATYDVGTTLQGSLVQPHFWNIGYEDGEPGDEGGYKIGVSYRVDPVPMVMNLGEVPAVKVFTGDNGDGEQMHFPVNGRRISATTTEDTPAGPLRYHHYRIDADELGGFNNAIASIDVPGGYRVVLYERAGFRGRSITFDRYDQVAARFSLDRFPLPSELTSMPTSIGRTALATTSARRMDRERRRATPSASPAAHLERTVTTVHRAGQQLAFDKEQPTWKGRVSSIEIVYLDPSQFIH